MKLKRQHITIALLLATVIATGAQEFVSGGIRYRVISDDEVAVAPWTEQGVSQYEGVCIVPEVVFYEDHNYHITTIADSAFYNAAITELQLPNSVTRIGRWAMADAFELTSVTLPLHLQEVSEGMLAGTDITSIIIPEGVTHIGDAAFEDCNRLHSLFLPSTIIEVGDYAFDGCHSLFEIYTSAPQPPAWVGDDAMPAVKGIDLVLIDDHAVDAWRADEMWGDHHRFSMWVNEDVTPSFELTDETWGDHWNRVELGRNLAYRVYGEDGYMMALTTANHYYLPITNHEAEYVIVPTNGISDADEVMPIQVTLPQLASIEDMNGTVAPPNIYAIDGVLHIDGDNHGTWTTIYDMYGRLYYERPSNDGQIITLHRNRVYIVIVGNYVKKIML